MKRARTPFDGPAAKAAREFGIDLTLTAQTLSLTPTERLKRLQRSADTLRQLEEVAKKSSTSSD